MRAPKPTRVFDTYWKFAVERQAIFLRRYAGLSEPWTEDSVLRNYRFTNVYRATDRVSQFLIGEVQSNRSRSQVFSEVFFRTILFKIFNRIGTWQALERRVGELQSHHLFDGKICAALNLAFANGEKLYSAAYIMPPPNFGKLRKHENHLALLDQMMRDGLPGTIAGSNSLRDVYDAFLSYPGIGPFLAFQYAIDINYSDAMSHMESDFVVAGPGARDGIAKCFENARDFSPEHLIHWTVDRQEGEFLRLALDFPGLFGRSLQLIDCQNLFCEISKYARVVHPDVVGTAGRTRIKQRYAAAKSPLPSLHFPKRWGITDVPAHEHARAQRRKIPHLAFTGS